MRRVLLVEDDDAVRSVLEVILTRAGWEVASVGGVDDAERTFGLEPTDVVLSDLVMPGKGAVELLGSLREHDPRLAFVVMSGQLTDERFRALLQDGASDCLAKPCEPDLLNRALERAVLLRRSLDGAVGADQPPSLAMPADLAERTHLLGRVDEAAQAGGFDLRRNRILLALDEAFTNAVKHGARGDRKRSIVVTASFTVHGGVVTVSDPGPGFDAGMANLERDRALSRRGMHLIRTACDDVRWIGRGNVCQMVFRQPPPEEVMAAQRARQARSERRRAKRMASSATLRPPVAGPGPA